LAIELDGSSHFGREEYDAERTALLELRNIRELRFPNSDVMLRLPVVVATIKAALAT
jgi:very-short-patch-repair endonuclease